MGQRHTDGSAGDADYGHIGPGYRGYRQPEPEFAVAIERALGNARRVLNVGAGAGSYEPRDRDVTAVEPSATMRAQRPPELSTAVDAVAENLPFDDDAFDAAMATFTVHQWPDLEAGLAEVRRVTMASGLLGRLACIPVREAFGGAKRAGARSVRGREALRAPRPTNACTHISVDVPPPAPPVRT